MDFLLFSDQDYMFTFLCVSRICSKLCEFMPNTKVNFSPAGPSKVTFSNTL